MSMEDDLSSIDIKSTETRVAASAFIGILWIGTCLSLCFVVFRIFVRLKVFRKLFIDDYLVLGAWVIILANAIFWQTEYKLIYQFYDNAADGLLPDAAFLKRFKLFLEIDNAMFVLFYTCLWAVKLSFLIFFRRLGLQISTGFTVWWWIVFGLSIASWFTCIGDTQWSCSQGNINEILVKCATPASKHFEWITLHYNCAIDVTTDIMIMTIPVLLLWNIKIPIGQKLLLLGLFSLTIITIIFSIIRVTFVTVPHMQPNIIWLAFWGNVEMPISVTVACLGSFRQLFVKQSPTFLNQQSFGFLPQPENISFWRRCLREDLENSPNTLDVTRVNTKPSNGCEMQNTSLERIISPELDSSRISDDSDVEYTPGSSMIVLSTPAAVLISQNQTLCKGSETENSHYHQTNELV